MKEVFRKKPVRIRSNPHEGCMRGLYIQGTISYILVNNVNEVVIEKISIIDEVIIKILFP